MGREEMSSREAYLAMFAFLEHYYALTKANDIGALLGQISTLADGSPADPAIARDWADAVARACSGDVDTALRLGS